MLKQVFYPKAVDNKNKVFVFKKHEVLKQPFPRLNLQGKVYKISSENLLSLIKINQSLNCPVTTENLLFIDTRTAELAQV